MRDPSLICEKVSIEKCKVNINSTFRGFCVEWEIRRNEILKVYIKKKELTGMCWGEGVIERGWKPGGWDTGGAVIAVYASAPGHHSHTTPRPTTSSTGCRRCCYCCSSSRPRHLRLRWRLLLRLQLLLMKMIQGLMRVNRSNL